MKKILITLLTLCYSFLTILAQPKQGQARIDSLISVLPLLKEDTNKVILLIKITFEYHRINPDEGIKYGHKSLALAQKIGWKMGISDAYRNLGINYGYGKSNNEFALENYFKSVKISEEINDKKGLYLTYNNIGLAYEGLSNYPKALEYYYNGLYLAESYNDKKTIVKYYTNIGYIFVVQQNYSKALEFYWNALKIDEELGDKIGKYCDLSGIGNIYYEQKNLTKALEYYFKALKIEQELGDKKAIAAEYNNIGNIYAEQSENLSNQWKKKAALISKSLEYTFKSLKLRNDLGEKIGVASCLGNIGDSYLYIIKVYSENKSINDFLPIDANDIPITKSIAINKAYLYLNQSIILCEEIGYLKNMIGCYENLSELHQLSGNYKDALQNYKHYIILRDSVFSEENKDKIASLSKQRVEDLKQKEIEIQKLQLEAAKKERWYFIIGIFVLAVFTWFTFNRFKQSQKQKNIIELKSIETQKQKAVIEEKQKEIMDSIHYASYIQQAVITSETYIGAHLPDFFVVYYPKDIVAGDFYWAYNVITNNGDEEFFLVTADCTGHGVPGAFMSLMGINFLNEIVVEQQINSPAEILNRLRKQIIQVFAQNKDGRSDGMDMNIFKLNKRDNTLTYAAANNPLWLMRNGELKEQSFQKMPVGAHHGTIVPFTDNTINLQKGDIIYTFTDGYADQFGGPHGKKFKYKQLEDLLIENCKSPMHEQKHILETAFNQWKGNLEQVDDVCLIGVKI